ncbi:hypothetical protein ACS0TY_002183 [Phlomoides rotata]
MAEESITIKDVVFVVDCGKAKATTYDALFATFMDIPNSCSAGLSVRDPFLLPQDKKNLAGTAKSRFSAKDYSDHMALVRAYEGCRKRRISVRQRETLMSFKTMDDGKVSSIWDNLIILRAGTKKNMMMNTFRNSY